MAYVLISLILMALSIFCTFYLAYYRKLHPLGIPILAAGIFSFIYVIQPVYLILSRDIYVYLDNWQIAKGIFIASIMYVFLVYGWIKGINRFKKKEKGNRITNRSRNKVVEIEKWNFARVYKIGTLITVIGIFIYFAFIVQSGGIYQFYGKPHAGGGAWQKQTAYVYMAQYWIYPGLILMFLACIRRPSSLRCLFIVLLTFIALADIILKSDRGNFFYLITVFSLPYYFAKKKIPSMKKVLFGGAVIGCIILLLVGYRGYLHLGAKEQSPPQLSEAISYMVSSPNVKGSTTGVEFIYHAGLIDTVDQLHKYHLGINWLYKLTVHMIPRLVWKEKPYAWDTPGITSEELESLLGWSHSSGSVPGVVGNIYSQFGMLSILFFFLFGWISAHFFVLLMINGTPINTVAYSMWYALSLKLFSQGGFGDILVLYLYIMVPTLLLIRLCRKKYYAKQGLLNSGISNMSVP